MSLGANPELLSRRLDLDAQFADAGRAVAKRPVPREQWHLWHSPYCKAQFRHAVLPPATTDAADAPGTPDEGEAVSATSATKRAPARAIRLVTFAALHDAVPDLHGPAVERYNSLRPSLLQLPLAARALHTVAVRGDTTFASLADAGRLVIPVAHATSESGMSAVLVHCRRGKAVRVRRAAHGDNLLSVATGLTAAVLSSSRHATLLVDDAATSLLPAVDWGRNLLDIPDAVVLPLPDRVPPAVSVLATASSCTVVWSAADAIRETILGGCQSPPDGSCEVALPDAGYDCVVLQTDVVGDFDWIIEGVK